jgi:ATP-dependent Clp protease ATP-binding subunit ClpA
MPDRFGKFTERARDMLRVAQAEASTLGHNYIGTEHLLLAMVRNPESLGTKVLVNLGATPDAVGSEISTFVARGSAVSGEKIGLTPRGKKAMELAVDEARRMNHHYIGTEHLLLGLIREGEGIAAGVLKSLDVDLDRARGEVARLLAIPDPARGPSGIGGMLPPWLQRDRGVKRYNLALPEDLFDQVQDLADREQTTVVEVLRRFVKLGLLATEIQDRPDAALIIREGGREREIVLL